MCGSWRMQFTPAGKGDMPLYGAVEIRHGLFSDVRDPASQPMLSLPSSQLEPTGLSHRLRRGYGFDLFGEVILNGLNSVCTEYGQTGATQKL